jgi:Polyprenyltransferase (cytochrome oxidase assembly factor)
MLPVVYGDRVTSQAIFWHTLALVVLSLSLFFYGMSWIYLLFAVFGGGYFLYCSILLMKEQSKALARKTFFSSIIHLGLLLLGAIFDAMIFA